MPSSPKHRKTDSQVKAAWIGAGAVVAAALITGLFSYMTAVTVAHITTNSTAGSGATSPSPWLSSVASASGGNSSSADAVPPGSLPSPEAGTPSTPRPTPSIVLPGRQGRGASPANLDTPSTPDTPSTSTEPVSSPVGERSWSTMAGKVKRSTWRQWPRPSDIRKVVFLVRLRVQSAVGEA